MTNRLTASEQEVLFTTECKLINLRYEYNGYDGEERWAVVSELTEKELMEKYPDVIVRYIPFVLLSVEQGETIARFRTNEDKHRKRMYRTVDIYGYDDELSSQFHSELCCYDEVPDEIREQMAQEELRANRIAALQEGIEQLTDIQKRRLKAVFFEGKTSRQVAEDEGVNYSKVDKSIMQALKKLKVFLENRGCKTAPLSK